jgi:hypothetical protein
MDVAKLSLNLILLKFKVRINGLLCLLDFGAKHLFVNPSAIMQLKWATAKVPKPIKVQLAHGAITLTNKVVFGAILDCDKAKFMENVMVYALDGIKAILGNTFQTLTM